MLGALLLAPVLLLADIWHSPQLSVVHRHPLLAGPARRSRSASSSRSRSCSPGDRRCSALLTVLALPFRVPIQTGASDLEPARPAVPRRRGRDALAGSCPCSGRIGERRAGSDAARHATGSSGCWRCTSCCTRVQSLYSVDFEKALQQMVFFYVPFALLFCLLRELDWTPRLVRRCLQLLVVLALLFAGVGFVEYATKTIFLNPKLIAANDVHTYFTVNSVFFDPDIFGRFLALVMILVAARAARAAVTRGSRSAPPACSRSCGARWS